jgi:hypothetical protein
MPMAEGGDRTELVEGMIEMGILTKRDALGMTKDFFKPACARCPHQRHGKGCTIYAVRPFGCRTWSCRWLLDDDTAELRRPDRSHYVVDMSPDYVTLNDGNDTVVPCIQIWIDPKYPDAYMDPALLAYLHRRALDGWAALIRFNSTQAFALFAPPLTPDGQWHKQGSKAHEREHTAEDKVRALGKMTLTFAVRP